MNASNASLDLALDGVPATQVRQPAVTREPVWVKWLLITVGLGWFAALLLLRVLAAPRWRARTTRSASSCATAA